MLKLMDVRMIADYQVHADSADATLFYVFPKGPNFAGLGDEGGVQLRFIEYEQLRVAGEDTFGGFVVFATDLAVPVADQQLILEGLAAEFLQRNPGAEAPVFKLSAPQWTGGTVSIGLQENGALVETIGRAAAPSLYGTNIACFALELTDIGTPVMKSALSEGAKSIVFVTYNLEFLAELPPNSASGVWHAEKFYTFVQDIDTEDNFWSEDSYTETVSSSRYNSEVLEITGTRIDNPNLTPQENEEVSKNLTLAVQQMLATMVERNLITAMTDVDPNTKALQDDQDIEDIKRNISSTQIADVRVAFTETRSIVMKRSPQGMLPAVTAVKGPDGQPLRWEDYYSLVSSDDFFRDKRVTVRVNADFEKLPIFSVVVSMTYPHSNPPKTDQMTFTKADDVKEFESLVVDGKRDVSYTYTVNYENSAFTFTSAPQTEDGDEVTVGVDDLGILAIDIAADGIDFDQVKRAQLHLSYAGAGSPIDKTLNLTKEAGAVEVREIIREARNAPVDYSVVYSLADGREVTGKPGQIPLGAKALTISDPFSAPKTVTFHATGDLENDIASIALEATYTDEPNDYVQKASFQLSKDKPSFPWSFPAIDDTAGSVSYAGFISRRNGTTEEIPETTTTRSVIQVGPQVAENLAVTVDPALLDWTKLKVVLVSLTHTGNDGAVLRKDFTFKDPAATAGVWTIPLADSANSSFTSSTTYFLLDGTRRLVGPVTETATTIFPELPPA